MFINKISACVCRMLKSFHAMKQSLQFLNRLVKLEVNILETVTHDRQKNVKWHWRSGIRNIFYIIYINEVL